MSDRTFRFNQGSGITLTGNATEKSMTIAANPQVVNSTAGTETDKAPSVAATKGLIASDAEFNAGTDGKLVTAKQFRGVVSGNNRMIFVDDANGNDATADGSEAKPFKTIQAAVDALSRVHSNSCYIIIKQGTYNITSPIDVGNINVPVLWITGQNHANKPLIRLTNSTEHMLYIGEVGNIHVFDLNFTNETNTQIHSLISVYTATKVNINRCVFEGPAGSGIFFGRGGHSVHHNTFKNVDTAINLYSWGSIVSFNNTTVSGVEWGLMAANGSVIFKTGTQPTGTTANEYTTGGGRII